MTETVLTPDFLDAALELRRQVLSFPLFRGMEPANQLALLTARATRIPILAAYASDVAAILWQMMDEDGELVKPVVATRTIEGKHGVYQIPLRM